MVENPPRPTVQLSQPRAWQISWIGAAVAVASLMVISVAVAGWYQSPQSTTQGHILGVSATQPLQVTVTVSAPFSHASATTILSTGTLTEALARAASALNSSLGYTSRGSSIYLTSFLETSNSPAGHWGIAVNGAPVTDLSLVTLNQGDQVTATWQ